MSQTYLAEQIDVVPSYISQIERGRTKMPSLDVVQKIAHELGTTTDDLLSAAGLRNPPPLPADRSTRDLAQELLARLDREEAQGFANVRELLPSDRAWFPLDGAIPAGYPSVIEQDHEPFIGLALNQEQRALLAGLGSNLRALIVQGDSMEGARKPIRDGHVVIYDPERRAISGDIVIALVDGESTLKRLVITDDCATLKADNPKYPSIDIRDELRGIVQGVVVAFYPTPNLNFLVAMPARPDDDF